MPYPFKRIIPISLKNFSILGSAGAPPIITNLKAPPKPSKTCLNTFLLKSIPKFNKKLLTLVAIFINFVYKFRAENNRFYIENTCIFQHFLLY